MRKTLGSVVREHREQLRLSQRELADQVGVKASHIAYIEGNQRRPSLRLLLRIADTLSLDRWELFTLSHPDAEDLIRDVRLPEKAKPGEAWRRFAADHALHRRNNIQPRELKLLRQVSQVQDVSCPKHFLFILNSIRQAGARD
jgi:XRE family transcriptional regulator of biofilm formation